MGAHDYIITVKDPSEKKVKEAWERQRDYDDDESGSHAYAGNATTFHGKVRFRDERLATENEARKSCLKHHEKREGPIAVSFYLPVEKGVREKNREVKTVEAYDKLLGKAKDVLIKANNALRDRKSKMIGCSSCGSKLSKEHFLKKYTVHTLFCSSRTGDPLNTFACPVCAAPLISETAIKRIKAYQPKIEAANKAVVEAYKPKAGKKIGWAVGGWAAS